MSLNLNQIPTAATSILSTDKMYIARSPFDVTDDRYILGSDILAQLGSPLTTKGDLYTFTTVPARLAVGVTNGQILQVNSATSSGLSWSTATYPGSTTINQILYSSSANVVAGITTGNNGVLITSAGGVPSISSTLPAAVQGNITAVGTIASGTWNGSGITVPYGGTGVASFTAYMPVCGGTTTTGVLQSVSTAGAVAGYALCYVSNAALPTWQAVGGTFTPAALTKTDDTNVTMTLGGTPATALLQATSMTLGWTGQLSLARGGTNASLTANTGGIVYSGASALAILAGTATANQVLLSGMTAAPIWSTATYPATTTVNQILYSSSNNVIAGLASAASAVLITSSGSVPSLSQTLPAAVQGNITVVGTIVTGVWNGSIIALAYGGTNANLTASNGGIVWSNASQMQILSGTATANQMLQSGSTATPSWSTSTWPATTTANQLLYSSFNNTVAGLSSAANGVLITSNSSVPSFLANSGTPGYVLTANSGAPPSWQVSGGSGTVNSGTQYNLAYYPATAAAVSGLANAGSAGLALLSGSPPAWSSSPPITRINDVIITSTQTYTPSTGTQFVDVSLAGPGGGSGGSSGSGTQGGAGAGGGGGGVAKRLYTIAQLGATAAVVIGLGGTAGTSGNNAGGNGSAASTFTPAGAGAVLTGNAANGGSGMAGSATINISGNGGAGGTATGGTENITGSDGLPGFIISDAIGALAGTGGGNALIPNNTYRASGNAAAIAGQNFGQGAAGGTNFSGGNIAGAVGGNGICIIREYISV